MTAERAVRAIVRGDVQGVGFRDFLTMSAQAQEERLAARQARHWSAGSMIPSALPVSMRTRGSGCPAGVASATIERIRRSVLS